MIRDTGEKTYRVIALGSFHQLISFYIFATSLEGARELAKQLANRDNNPREVISVEVTA